MAGTKLSTKFNIILSSLLIGLFLLTALLTYRDQQEMVQKIALEEGQSVARQLLETFNHMSDIVEDEPENNYALVPQVVANQIAKRISRDSRYTVRQVSLRYRNPENRPDAYEAEQLKAFADGTESEIQQVVKSGGKEIFHYMKPLPADASCLKCHGTYESAPTFIQQRYPPEHPSYNYRIGEIIGAISFSKPMEELYQDVAISVQQELLYRLAILLLVILVTWILVRRVIIKPIQLASETIHRVTQTGDLGERIPVKKANDEVGQLIMNFNEMMQELDRTALQRQESEERYRSLIETAESAIITFLDNGKIVITNKPAEQLLGFSRTRLLGESLFDFFQNGEVLQQRVALISDSDGRHRKEDTARYQLRQADGNLIEMEVTLVLASESEHKPLFTAIMRRVEESR